MLPFLTQLGTDAAALLASERPDLFAWDPTGEYATSARARIYVGPAPGAPGTVVSLTAYSVGDAVATTGGMSALQVRVAAAEGEDPEEYADAVFRVLHSRRDVTLAGVHVPMLWRVSHANLGMDDGGRLETASNYYMHAAQVGAESE